MVKINVRKLIGFGKNSYIISLPKQWLEKNKVKKGDLISVDEVREGLLLKTNSNDAGKEEETTITIDAENKSLNTLKTEIVSAYLNNYNIIEVVSKDLKTNAPEIRDILHNLSGLEIINQSLTKIVAKDLINIKEVSIKTLIRRMDNILRSMMQDTLDCFEGVDHAASISHIDEEVNRLHFLAYRIIRSGLKDNRIANSLGTTALELHSDHTATTKIEKIADNIKRICRYSLLMGLDEKWMNELKEIFRQIQNSYTEVMKAYYTNDIKLALKIEETNRERIILCDDFFGKHAHKSQEFKVKKKGICDFRDSCGATVKVVENMKEMGSSIKDIARTVME